MSDPVTLLELLAKEMAVRNEPDLPSDFVQRMSVTKIGGLCDIDFYGNPFDETYSRMASAIVQPEIAGVIRSLSLRGPDEGANGTRNWDLEPFTLGGGFPNLESLAIQLSQPSDHNRSIIGRDFDEDGVVARLAKAMPKLRSLTIPSAPNSDFFRLGVTRIATLSVDAGYTHQDFIRNLAWTSSFPSLVSLEWGEYNETYLEHFEQNCTPNDAMALLFRTINLPGLRRLVLRNPLLSNDAIAVLKRQRADLQVLVVRTSSNYV